ncbi:MAG: MotA/TolQ/ExbB proton channel family protein [Deltaproteobacteria bacterium]|nr:MotA/TolQ/ExbB proton channel family protein [Deltaproteobacteria bacterium]
MIDLIQKGGIVMYPIFLCSIIALGIFIERLWILRKKAVIPDDLVSFVEERLQKKNIPAAVDVCEKNSSSIAKIFLAGLKRSGKGMWLVKEAVEERGSRESVILEKKISMLSTIANLSTLLELMGTVSDMIKTFKVVSQGSGNPALLAGGIAEALITTAAGLCVAIPVLVGHRYLKNKTESLIFEMEESSIRMIEIMENATRKE